MTGKEALKELFELAVFDDNCNLNECKKCSVKLKHNCAYRYYKTIEKDLEILEIFKKHLKFKISDKPANDGSYIIFIDDFDDDYDYMCFAISKEEKDLLKKWLEYGDNIY